MPTDSGTCGCEPTRFSKMKSDIRTKRAESDNLAITSCRRLTSTTTTTWQSQQQNEEEVNESLVSGRYRTPQPIRRANLLSEYNYSCEKAHKIHKNGTRLGAVVVLFLTSRISRISSSKQRITISSSCYPPCSKMFMCFFKEKEVVKAIQNSKHHCFS